MMTVEIKANGILIGHLRIVNEGALEVSDEERLVMEHTGATIFRREGPHRYSYTLYEPESGRDKKLLEGGLKHDRELDYTMLLRKIFAQMAKRKKEMVPIA